MPRTAAARQRIVFCDCFDCSDKAIEPTVVTDEGLAACERVAQQRPPPKAVVLFGSGLLHSWEGRHSLADTDVPHLDQLTKEGCLGVVALRPAAEDGLPHGTHELHQWCNLASPPGQGAPPQPVDDAAAQPMQAKTDNLAAGTFAAMFQGMQVVAASNAPAAQAMLTSLGAALPEPLQLRQPGSSAGNTTEPQRQPDQGGDLSAPPPLPEPQAYVQHMLACLGADEAASGPDMLVVHLDRRALQQPQYQDREGGEQQQQQQASAGVEQSGSAAPHQAACSGLRWLDAVAGALLQRQHVREQVLLCVLLTSQGDPAPVRSRGALQGLSPAVQLQAPALLQRPGVPLDPAARVATPRDAYALQLSGPEGDDALHGLGLLTVSDERATAPQALTVVPRPLQSWQRRGLQHVEVDVGAPGLCARRLPGVMRRDRAEALSFDEVLLRGGLGATLVDHVLPEIAYKLGRAPKYGA